MTTDLALGRQYLRPIHGVANLAWLLTLHGALLGALWWLPLPAALVCCVLHQRLLSEWFHEATHWHLLPHRVWNDRVADLLIGPFNGTRVQANRRGHFRHHAAPAFFLPADPDTGKAGATTRQELWRGLARDLTGRTALSAFFRATWPATAPDGATRTSPEAPGFKFPGGWFLALALLHGAGLTATLLAGRFALYPLYFGALLTLYPVANRLRLYAQHGEFRADGSVRLNGSTTSRSVHAGWLEQVLLHSSLIMYHQEHHARPTLPFRALRAIATPSSDPNLMTRSGGGLLRALLGSLR